MMKFRGVRGATTAEANTAEAILSATQELIEAINEAIGLDEGPVVNSYFTEFIIQ